MKIRKKALLIALVLGDGCIRIDSRWKTPRGVLKLCHAKRQLDYLKYKVALLHSLIGGSKPIIKEYTCKWPDGSKYQQVKTEKGHKYFRILKRWMYPNKYNINCLKHLTPEALAIWYMDDGSIIANNRYPDGTCSSARTNIHTCTSKENADLVCKYFKDFWDIKFTTFFERGTYSIRCFHKEGRKFHELIHDFIIPSMKYKQRFYYDTSA